MKLQRKFWLIIVLVSAVPLFIYFIYTYQRYDGIVRWQTQQSAQNLMTITSSYANNALATIEHITEAMYLPDEEQISLTDRMKKYRTVQPVSSIVVDNLEMKSTYESYFYNYDYINGIFFVSPMGQVTGYSSGIAFRNDYSPELSSWYEKAVAAEGKTYIYGASQKQFLTNSAESVSFCTALYDPFDREFLGVLFVDCSLSMFDLSPVNPLPDITLLSVVNDSSILYQNSAFVSPDFSREKAVEYKQELSLEGLTLYAYIDQALLMRKTGITQATLVVLALISLIAIFIAGTVFSRSLTRPITYLSDQMLLPEEAQDIENTAYFQYGDEIGTLYNSYQQMMDERREYVKNELENKLIILDSQMKALESQINAHFLYNTLDSVSSLAVKYKADDIAVMSYALSDMFRYSIKTKSEMVPLKMELKHVQDYVSIQQIRFSHGFALELDIPERLLEKNVLKLILQPLVENALYHGLQSCRISGKIRIHGEIRDENLVLEVQDNGVGMPESQLKKVRELLNEKPAFTELGERHGGSIGIKNIHTRIRLYYGQPYGLSISSEEGCGTTVTVLVPVAH